MGRPRLEISTFGEINTTELANSRWSARARYRDRDGVTREVKATGDSAAKAKAALRGKLRDRRRGPAGADEELTPESTVEDLLKHWLATCRPTGVPSGDTTGCGSSMCSWRPAPVSEKCCR